MDYLSDLECKNVLKNFIMMSVSIICYLRNLFTEDVFEDAKIGDLHLKRLTKSIPESSNLIDWIDYGIYDTIIKEYLKTMVISIHDINNIPLESYYISINPMIDKNNVNITKDVIKNNTLKSLRELILLIQSLSPLYDYSYLSIKLLYIDTVPDNYEPKYFKRNDDKIINLPFIPITILNNGYNNIVIELYTISNIIESSTNHLTKSNNKTSSTTKFGSNNKINSDDNLINISNNSKDNLEDNDDLVIVKLIDKSRDLCKKYKYISKSTISTGLAINMTIAKVLIKRLIDNDILDVKFIKGKGYTSKIYVSEG